MPVVRPPVLCAACGVKFDAEGATTGDRVRCPMCGETVEVAEILAERRRVAKTNDVRPHESRRLSAADLKRVYVRLFVAIGIAAAILAVWLFRDAISDAAHDVGARLGKSR